MIFCAYVREFFRVHTSNNGIIYLFIQKIPYLCNDFDFSLIINTKVLLAYYGWIFS